MLGVGFVLGVGFELRVTPKVVARGGFISISILRPAPHHSTVIGTKRVRHRWTGWEWVGGFDSHRFNLPKIVSDFPEVDSFQKREEIVTQKPPRSIFLGTSPSISAASFSSKSLEWPMPGR